MKKYVPVPKIFAHVWEGVRPDPPLALLGGAKSLGHTRVNHNDWLLWQQGLVWGKFKWHH